MTSRAAVVVLLLMSIACRRDEAPAPAQKTSTATTTVAADPQDLAAAKVDTTIPIPKPPVAGCEVKETFAANEPIDFVMNLNESPEGLQVAALVIDGPRELARVQVPAEGKKSVTIRLPKLAAGKYRVEGYWGGNLGCQEVIEIKK